MIRFGYSRKVCRILFVPLLFFTVLPFCACRDSTRTKKIKLRAVVNPAEMEAGAGAYKGTPLRISVASMLSPKSSFVTYWDLAQYLGKRLDMPVKVAFRKNYAVTNDSLKNSQSDIAFVCTGTYLAGKEAFPLDVLAVPVVNGGTVFNSVIVTGKNSPARSLGDLRGKVFAFTDEFSLTGRLYIQARLADLKQTSGFFGDTVFTGNHDNSIKAVAEGFADAACVDGHVYQVLLNRGDLYAKKLKILEKSPPFGNPPVVARGNLSSDIKNKVRAALLDMHKNEEGMRTLKAIAIERYVTPAPGFYSSAEKLYKELNKN